MSTSLPKNIEKCSAGVHLVSYIMWMAPELSYGLWKVQEVPWISQAWVLCLTELNSRESAWFSLNTWRAANFAGLTLRIKQLVWSLGNELKNRLGQYSIYWLKKSFQRWKWHAKCFSIFITIPSLSTWFALVGRINLTKSFAAKNMQYFHYSSK